MLESAGSLPKKSSPGRRSPGIARSLVALILAAALGCDSGQPGGEQQTDAGELDLVLAGGRVIDPETGLDAVLRRGHSWRPDRRRFGSLATGSAEQQR